MSILAGVTPGELLFSAVVFVGFLIAVYFAEIVREEKHE